MWNPHSVMFEVAWCVMLYTTILSLEFSGMVFEKLRWPRAVKVQKMLSLPLVIGGVILSTLHQSSLGTIYLIVPGKLHEIWYTPILPMLFFVSAVSVGLAMVIVESRLSARAFGRRLEMSILAQVGRVLVGVLGIYGVMRLFDLANRGALGEAFSLSYESWMFLLEFGAGVLLPMALLAVPRIRHNASGLSGAALLAVMGFVVNRLNVSLTGFESAQGGHYVPAWSEIAITLMLVAIGFAAFGFAVRHFNVYPEETPSERSERKQPREWMPSETPKTPRPRALGANRLG
jgi:Ni/Fe-hydrogenase subunit HybB-like protein